MDRTERGLGEASTGRAAAAQAVPGDIHALFQQRVDGDDALLKLARLRFAQMGAAAEVYADTPDQLEHVLQFVPSHACLPVVHLSRGVNVLHGRDRAVVREFADRFAGRVAGLVVHDKREMGAQTDRLLAAMRELNARLCERPDGPLLFLEYAAGLDRGWFVEVAERLQEAERVSFCIDVGHIGLRQVAARFADRHPGLDLKKLSPVDDRLPDLVADIQDAVGGALPHVLDVIRSLGRLGKHVHFHLHDGHPLVPGLRDHFSFLTRLPISFSYQGRRSLSMMYGPGGLASIVSTAIDACPPQGVSFTLEIHQVEGRLPLADGAWLFPHWQDTTNAERMNYWLSVLSENVMLISQHAHLPGHERPAGRRGLPSRDSVSQESGQHRGQFLRPFQRRQMPGPRQLDRPRAGQHRGQPGRDQPEVRQVLGPGHDQAGRSDRAQVNANHRILNHRASPGTGGSACLSRTCSAPRAGFIALMQNLPRERVHDRRHRAGHR